MPDGATVSISDEDSPVASISADVAGDYIVELSAGNSLSDSVSDTVVLTIDPLLNPTYTELTFDNDIMPILSGCAACHVDGGFFAAIPVDFSNTNPDLFMDVIARVNLNDPESSQLLTKPTGLNHGGGMSINRTNAAGEATYQTLLNWLANGAPCGTDVTVCPN